MSLELMTAPYLRVCGDRARVGVESATDGERRRWVLTSDNDDGDSAAESILLKEENGRRGCTQRPTPNLQVTELVLPALVQPERIIN